MRLGRTRKALALAMAGSLLLLGSSLPASADDGADGTADPSTIGGEGVTSQGDPGPGAGNPPPDDPPPDDPPPGDPPPDGNPPPEDPPADPPPNDPPPDDPPADEPPVEDPPADPPPDEDPPAGDPPADDPPVDEPPTDDENGDGDGEEGEEEEVEFDPTDPEQVFREIVFPVVGATSFFAGFGDCRDGCTRLHNGIDIMTYGWKGAPVVAAHDGRVIRTVTDGRLAGCAVVIRAADGWTSHYAHLNDDLPGSDTRGDLCFAPGIEVGADVTAGTIIGWVGDSGNAENTSPHLHFEIRNPDGIPVDAWYSLIDARRIDYQLIDSAMLAELNTTLHPEGQETVFVASERTLLDSDYLASHPINASLLILDPADPLPTQTALRELAPDRIVFLSDSPEAEVVPWLTEFDAVVEVITPAPEPDDADSSALEDDRTDDPTMVDAEEADDVEDPGDAEDSTDEAEEPSPIHEATAPSVLAVVGATAGDEELDGIEGVLRIVSDITPPASVGEPLPGRPKPEANRNLLWWPSATAWLATPAILEEKPLLVAYVPDPEDQASIDFIVSLSTAPPMPLWHHQPTSRTIRSL